MNNKSVLVSVIILIVIGGGIFLVSNLFQNGSSSSTIVLPTPSFPPSPDSPTTPPTPPPVYNLNPTPPPAGEPLACTQEAKQCSDGSYVSRTGPNCEFAACPVVASTTHNVSIKNFAFSPSSISVKKGDTVVWTNKDSAPHTVRIKWVYDDSGDSGPINQGQTFSYTFIDTGSFTYDCSFHPSMTGKVIVTN